MSDEPAPTSTPTEPRAGEERPIGVIGAGWVGLVTGISLARLGLKVLIADSDPLRCQQLTSGDLEIHEPGLAEAFAASRARIEFTSSTEQLLAQVETALVCVGTPPTISGDADLTALRSVIDQIPERRAERLLLVVKSTVPSGTGKRIRALLDQRGFTDVGYVSNPEFLAEGSALSDLANADRIVIGAFEQADADRLSAIYRPLHRPVVITDVCSAEMIKVASNAFLATKISFINEIATLCALTGADVDEVAAGMGLDQRIGKRFLAAGLGWGGSCFGKDVLALTRIAASAGHTSPILAATLEVNHLQQRSISARLRKHYPSLDGIVVTLLGLAYKPHTNDLRDAPALMVARVLQSAGAIVRAWDPVVTHVAELPRLSVFADPLEALSGADAAVIVTDWPQIALLDFEQVLVRMAAPVLIDGRNMLNPQLLRDQGFSYESIGRP